MSLDKLVDEITKPFLNEGINDPGILKAIFLAGGPGSGKGYVSKGLFGIPKKVNVSAYGMKVVNQDRELERMLKKYGFGTDLDDMPEELFRQLTDPDYEDYSGMRSRAKEMTTDRKKMYMQGRLGLIIDGTGHKYGSIKKKKKELEEIGYDCFMVFVHTDLEVAQQRNMERPRKLNPEIVETSWKDVQKNKISFQGLFGNENFLMVDNSKTLGEKAAIQKFKILMKKGINKFIKRPIKNYRGKRWIEKQKIMKEDINLPVKVGDTILAGRFKNKKIVVKTIGKDEHGMPTINGKKVVNFRIPKKVDEMGLVGGDGVIQGSSKVSKVKKMKKRGHTSVPYGSGYKKVKENKSVIESEVKTIHSLLQKFGNSPKDATDMIKKHYKKVQKKFRGQTPRDKTMALIGLSLLGENKELYKMYTQAMKMMPGSPKQKELIKKISALRKKLKMNEAPRKPRKKGQHRNSPNHSDLYTDENPKGTIKGLKFATVKDAQSSVSKIRNSGKSHAHKIQAAVAMEQRAREMGKASQAAVYRKYINQMKKKTKKKNEVSESDCGAKKNTETVAQYRKRCGNRPLGMIGATKVVEQPTKIKKVIGVYPGRFQPFGPHHYKTYKWLKSKVDEVYITTSDIKKPPRHPMNFKEKVQHMTKMGVPKNRIVQEKMPYVANNLLKKFGEDTAVVYIFGAKDAGRLVGGKKKSGGLTYYQDYKKNKGNLKSHKEHGYILTAPHVSIKVGGKEVSGTVMRQLLGSSEFDDKERQKLFKKAFGYFDKNVYIMMTNKFKKLFELYEHLFESSNIQTAGEVDDGPGFISSLKKYRDRAEVEAGKLGWEIAKLLVDDEIYGNQTFDFVKGTEYPNGPVDSVSFGPAGVQEPSAQNLTDYVGTELWNRWLDHIDMVLSNQEYDYVDSMARERKSVVKDSPKTAKQLDAEEPIETDVNRGNEQHQDYDIVEEIKELAKENILNSNKSYDDRELLLMGGAYGHMAHPFDDNDLTFGDLKKIITLGLGGQLNREDGVTEKLDGQNLMISWRDGRLIVARNKGHIKNGGVNALSVKGVQSKFKGRGKIRDAFVFAVRDLQKAIGSLSKKQQVKIFGNGNKWMNLEVLWPASENVINYDVTQIVFHGALEYDDSARVIGQAKDSARMLAGMIKQINQNIQKKYKIGKPNFLNVPKHQDFGKMKDKFLGQLKKLQSTYGLKDNDTLALYHQHYWQEWIMNGVKQTDNPKITNDTLIKLTKRWAFFDKSYTIPMIKKDFKDYPKFLDWVLTTDKIDKNKMVKDNMKPFEELFFGVGAEIMKNVEGWLAVNPKKSVQSIRAKVKGAISTIRSGGDLKKLNKLKIQLDRLNAIGGFDSIIPSEGIVFKYKGKTYKFTGAFAPVNQITGLLMFNR